MGLLQKIFGSKNQRELKKLQPIINRIAELEPTMKAKSDDDVVPVLEKLGSKKHPKILEELKAWLQKGSEEIRITAAEQIATFSKDPKASDALLGAARSTNSKKDLQKLTIECIQGVGRIGVRAHAKQLVGYFNHTDIDIAAAAIDACGRLKSKDLLPLRPGFLPLRPVQKKH